MRPITLLVGPLAAASANNIALSQTPTSGTALTLAGAAVTSGIAYLTTARRVLATYGSEASARTLRITGTNSDGNPIRETVAIPVTTPGTVATVQDFLTVTEVMPLGGGWTAALTVGTNTIASSPWKMLNSPNMGSTQLTMRGSFVAGTGTFGIETTLTPLNDNANAFAGQLGNYPTPPAPDTYTVMTGRTATSQGSLDNPVVAWRAVLNNGGDTTTQIQINAIEGGVTESR